MPCDQVCASWPDLHSKLWRVASPSLTVLRTGASRFVTIRLCSWARPRETQVQSAAIAFTYGEPAWAPLTSRSTETAALKASTPKCATSAVVLSPVVVPGVITAVGLYFFFAPIGLTGSYLGLILAHTALATPFVVIPVSATLQSFDVNLARAAASLGASPLYAFRGVILPLILPGLASGALFAFATSFDEVVIVLFMAGPGAPSVRWLFYSFRACSVDRSVLVLTMSRRPLRSRRDEMHPPKPPCLI